MSMGKTKKGPKSYKFQLSNKPLIDNSPELGKNEPIQTGTSKSFKTSHTFLYLEFPSASSCQATKAWPTWAHMVDSDKLIMVEAVVTSNKLLRTAMVALGYGFRWGLGCPTHTPTPHKPAL